MRKILLIEPNYKNKYPPMGLMKLATYYRKKGDDVRFFKGDLLDLAAELIVEKTIKNLRTVNPEQNWKSLCEPIFKYIRKGKYEDIEQYEILRREDVLDVLKNYRNQFRNKQYFKEPEFDVVGITTLFTFYWKITIETINFAKQLCKNIQKVMVGGIMSTILPNEVFAATGIHPHIGLLDKPGDIDEGDTDIIDELPLDYSILDEIDYEYPASNAYFAYMTRGCINKCSFCAVPTLEPTYRDYIGLKEQIEYTKELFGEKRDLLLLDNNVLASCQFDKIIDEIKDCGFNQDDKYLKVNEYAITIRNLRQSYNDRAYIRKAVKLFKSLEINLSQQEEKQKVYDLCSKYGCLNYYTATKENILRLDRFIRPLYEKTFKQSLVKRRVDFNQGVEGKLVNVQNMSRLSETCISPLRIAFDHWEWRESYENSIRTAVGQGIKKLSNYLLYNYLDKPEHLYYRMRINVDLCEELNATIFSFPMKYHPINDPNYFMNRNFIGKYWSRKYIRAIQAVLNSTKGKIGRGVDFFNQAFGENVEEFKRILLMPEAFIIYRARYDENLRNLMNKKNRDKGQDPKEYKGANNFANEWWIKYSALTEKQKKTANRIIEANKFNDGDYECDDNQILDVLSYYKITRED